MSWYRVLSFLERIDRRVIYLLVVVTLYYPLALNWRLEPAPMKSSSAFFNVVSKLEKDSGKIVLVAIDWEAGTQAENLPQTEVALEHLLRKRIPFALISITPFATPFMEKIPLDIVERLRAELPNEYWSYGKDWVNLGYQPGGMVMIQGIAKSKDLAALLKTDSYATPLKMLPAFAKISSVADVSLLMEFTGLSGAMSTWVQAFQSDEHKVPFVHGCTSITIPEAYNYFSAGQIVGLFEGVAGAAWYEKLLSDRYPERVEGKSNRNNTSLAVAQILIMLLVIIGNAAAFFRSKVRQPSEVTA